MSFWFDDAKRLETAKRLQIARIEFIQKVWSKDKELKFAGATTLWVLGIPHGFAVMHGKTRRGALVFDVADLIKDAIVLPWAFVCAKEKQSEKEFRSQCLQSFVEHKALDFMFDEVKRASLCLATG